MIMILILKHARRRAFYVLGFSLAFVWSLQMVLNNNAHSASNSVKTASSTTAPVSSCLKSPRG